MPGHELERIIRTAVSIDLAWKGSEVKPYSYYSRFLFQRIEEVKLLPGGHFMIVSCKTHDKQYGISLWTLNHPATHQPAPLLFRITDVKAYGLQTKYMTVKGEKGICITFTRRWFKDKNDKSHWYVALIVTLSFLADSLLPNTAQRRSSSEAKKMKKIIIIPSDTNV